MLANANGCTHPGHYNAAVLKSNINSKEGLKKITFMPKCMAERFITEICLHGNSYN